MFGSSSSGGFGGTGPPSSRYNYGHGSHGSSYPTASTTRTTTSAPRTEEIRTMINNLRVEELKKFLHAAGKDHRGKKCELQARALELVSRGKTLDPDVLKTLQELHRQRSNDHRHLSDYPSSDHWSSYSSSSAAESVSGYRKTTGYASATVTGNGVSSTASTSGLPSYQSSSTSNYRSMPGISTLFSQPSSMSDIPGRSTLGSLKSSANTYDPISYYNSIPASKIPMPSNRPVIPLSVADLTLTPLPFFDEKSVIVQPVVLTPKHDSRTGYHELNQSFTLSTEQANEISSSRKVFPVIAPAQGQPSSKVEFGVQILVRFAMATLGPTGNREVTEDCVPLTLSVRVNGKPVNVITLPVDKKNASVQFKMCRPVEITQSCKISPINQNTIQLTWQQPTLPSAMGSLSGSIDYSKTFCLSASMVKKLSSDDLLKSVKNKGMKHREFTASLIRDKLRDTDDEIATTSLRAQLVCPLGKMRIRTPGRSTICTHIQCFDILLFLQMNERKPTWSCPVCDKKIPFSTLVVDGLFTDILNSNRSENCTEVAFLEKPSPSQGYGSSIIDWDPILKEEKSVKQEPKTESSKRGAAAPIDLSPKTNSPMTKRSKKDEPEVIDLLSSDEDDASNPMDLRRNSTESDDTILEGSSDESTSVDDYFDEFFPRSKGGGKSERTDRRLRSSSEGGGGSSSGAQPSTSNRQPANPPSALDDSDDSDLVILD